MDRLTIVLADDHHVVRDGLRVLLERELDCSVVGEAGDGQEAVALVELGRLLPASIVIGAGDASQLCNVCWKWPAQLGLHRPSDESVVTKRQTGPSRPPLLPAV